MLKKADAVPSASRGKGDKQQCCVVCRCGKYIKYDSNRFKHYRTCRDLLMHLAALNIYLHNATWPTDCAPPTNPTAGADAGGPAAPPRDAKCGGKY